ncbi:GNAT family N-acetyltransferase [Sphingobacterium sp. N143]|uniref:GNAT family N-acetyltransferase n=1 Tax=Sphingobacterium sp. N143 TaxID=2746727 RepID=UPI002574F085|nr:GNAT family N-acetyltransferase [Sphingobacterium sp. N143]MDM1292779.1 GNAT family N-acetyltransferase [Sphingobacterium sp. N143]
MKYSINSISITKVNEWDIPMVLPYVIAFRKQLFPMLVADKLPKDLRDFKQLYIDQQTGTFLQAKDSTGKLVGVIGMLPYDYRFPHLDIDQRKTVEVARLFVDPDYRRSGLGTALFNQLTQVAREKNVERLYLHTHPFLEGAYEFWSKQGFHLKDFRDESNFPTIHMEVMIDQMQMSSSIRALELTK